MNILNIYEKFYKDLNRDNNDDYSLVKICDYMFVGEDANGNVSVVLKSSEPNRDGIAMKTKLMSFECNTLLESVIGTEKVEDYCHIFKCYSNDDNDRRYFLELCGAFFVKMDIKIEDIVEIFNTLNELFNKNTKLSNSEMEGLFGELYTIYHFYNRVDLSSFYQKKEKQKFDFNVDENTKIEVKTTFNKDRIHRFRHDQLTLDNTKVFLVSYKMLKDQNGLNLYELLNKVINYFYNQPYIKARLLSYMKNDLDIQVLKSFSINENYLISNMRIYDSETIPHFKQKNPQFVSGTEYDSNCDAAKEISEDEFVSYLI